MKKVKKHEPQAIKEDPKKIARRLRAQKRRERQTTEDVVAKKTPRKIPRRVDREEIRDKSSDVVSRGVPESEEESFLSLNDLNGMVSPHLRGFVKFCPAHYNEMLDTLKAREMTPWMAVDVADLRDKIKNKQVEPLFHSFDALIRLAMKAIGEEALRQFHCPICAFTRNNYVVQVVEAMNQLVSEKAVTK